MKNKIFAILILICMCISMFPMSVFADTYTVKQLYEQEYVGTKHTFNYYAPNTWTDIYILNTNKGIAVMYVDPSQTISYSNENLGIIQNDSKEGMYYTYFSTIEEVEDFVFNGTTEKIDMTYSREIVAYQIIAYTKSVQGNYSGTAGDTSIVSRQFEEYYEKNMYDGPTGNFEYMKGNYYAIFKQAVERDGWDNEINGGVGYVDTMKYVEMTPDDGFFMYVVISTEENDGDLISITWSEIFTSKWQYLFHNLALITGEGERNGYKYTQHNGLFYNKNETINRYYFSNANDAVKFVLYGTEGAQYQYKEIGQTDYGYGYSECLYSNYEISGFGKQTIPREQYPLKRAELILRWHDENVYDRDYLWIEFDYFPYSSIIGTDSILRISSQLNPEIKVAYKNEENESTWNAYDKTIYEEQYYYNTPALQKFYIYSSKLDEIYISNSWDIIYSTYSIYAAEYDNDDEIGIDELGKQEEQYSIWEDKDGNKYLENKDTGEIFKEGEEDPYIWNEEKQIYENSKGEQLDKNTLTNTMKEWRDSIIEYQDSLIKVSEIIQDFTDIIDDAKDKVKDLTDLFNAFFLSIPGVFRTIITFSILALILMRIIRRK